MPENNYMKHILPYGLCLLLTPLLFTNSIAQTDEENWRALRTSVYADSLKAGNTYRVNVFIEGCYTTSGLDIKISKTKTGYYADITRKFKINSERKTDIKKGTKKITIQQLDSLRLLEQLIAGEVMRIHQAGGVVSTASDCRDFVRYTISMGGHKKEYADWDCHLNWAERLRNLFAIE